jgi:hypothetical protein
MPDEAPVITIILSVNCRSTMCSLGVEDRGDQFAYEPNAVSSWISARLGDQSATGVLSSETFHRRRRLLIAG